jgi:hypothetical protein
MSLTVFVLGATAVAFVGATALLPWLAGGDALAARWAARGFLAMAVPAVAGGAWLAREHGRVESRFVMAVLTGILVRLLAAVVVAQGAAKAGGSAMTGLAAGLIAGFVPVTAFQAVWLARSRNASGVATETRG